MRLDAIRRLRSRPGRASRISGLLGACLLLGLATVPGPSDAQQSSSSRFGGYILSGRANGIQLTYDSPGLLPVGSPIFQLSIPESLATASNGPTGYALASFVYPGPLVADLGAALAVGGTDAPIPEWQVRSQAYWPGGPTEQTSGQQGTEMTAVTAEDDSRSVASYQNLIVPGALSRVGSMRSLSQSVVEGSQVVARARTEVSDVSLLGGLIEIESIVTDLVSTSDGTAAATAGQTVVNGFTLAGEAVIVDGDGVRFVDDPTDDDDPTGGALDPVGGLVGDLLDGAAPVNEALNAVLDQLGAAGDDAAEQLLAASGIEIRLLDPIETVSGGTAERLANGLLIQVNYDGGNTPVLTDLLSAIPSDQLPTNEIIPGTPTSPQGMFNLLKEKHITGFALGPAAVSSLATPPFSPSPSFRPTTPSLVGGSGGSGSTGGGVGSPLTAGTGGTFSQPTPLLGGGTTTPDLVPAGSALDDLRLGPANPAVLLGLALLASPFLANRLRRFAVDTLDAAQPRSGAGGSAGGPS